MLEAPEAKIIAGQLTETIKGKRVSVVVAGQTPHKFTFFSGNTDEYENCLSGKTVGNAHNYGGMVEVEVGDHRLLFSDGANINYLAAGAKLPAKHQLLVGFDDESCIVVSVRMYGGVGCYPAGKLEDGPVEYFQIARDKPQVLSEDFGREYFMELIDSEAMQAKSAKAALATGQSIPGLGNGVLQDILYNAGVHPKTKIKDLPPAKRGKMFDALKGTLGEMVEKGGRNTETDIFGRNGSYVPWLSKDTAGHPCTRCGQLIVKENYMGGSIYYCPGCQPK